MKDQMPQTTAMNGCGAKHLKLLLAIVGIMLSLLTAFTAFGIGIQNTLRAEVRAENARTVAENEKLAERVRRTELQVESLTARVEERLINQGKTLDEIKQALKQQRP